LPRNLGGSELRALNCGCRHRYREDRNQHSEGDDNKLEACGSTL
jgi:hypothetical protein